MRFLIRNEFSFKISHLKDIGIPIVARSKFWEGNHTFEVNLISDEESREGTLEWVPYDQVLTKQTWEGDYEIFKWILEDKPFFSAKFSYDCNQNLIDKTVTFYDK